MRSWICNIVSDWSTCSCSDLDITYFLRASSSILSWLAYIWLIRFTFWSISKCFCFRFCIARPWPCVISETRSSNSYFYLLMIPLSCWFVSSSLSFSSLTSSNCITKAVLVLFYYFVSSSNLDSSLLIFLSWISLSSRASSICLSNLSISSVFVSICSLSLCSANVSYAFLASLAFLNWFSKISFYSFNELTCCWNVSSRVVNSWFMMSSCSVMGKRSLSIIYYNLFFDDWTSLCLSSLLLRSCSSDVIL